MELLDYDKSLQFVDKKPTTLSPLFRSSPYLLRVGVIPGGSTDALAYR